MGLSRCLQSRKGVIVSRVKGGFKFTGRCLPGLIKYNQLNTAL